MAGGAIPDGRGDTEVGGQVGGEVAFRQGASPRATTVRDDARSRQQAGVDGALDDHPGPSTSDHGITSSAAARSIADSAGCSLSTWSMVSARIDCVGSWLHDPMARISPLSRVPSQTVLSCRPVVPKSRIGSFMRAPLLRANGARAPGWVSSSRSLPPMRDRRGGCLVAREVRASGTLGTRAESGIPAPVAAVPTSRRDRVLGKKHSLS